MPTPMRILIADDVPSARKVLKKLLAKLGHLDIVEVSDGEQGVEVLQRQPFDLVISDWEMPKMDGIGLLHAMRALPETSKVPLLFVTSSNSKDQVLAALKAGVTAYLCKPFSLEMLNDKVKELTEEKSGAASN